ncbi:MAG: flagellar protein FlgN [Clostridia bacterium]|nr:flagellar protein FlgN [Clostridia bacterium]
MTCSTPDVELIERIHSFREDELAQYTAMLRLSGVQRELIQAGDTDALARATEEKARVIAQIDAISRKIAGLLGQLGAARGSAHDVHPCLHPEMGAAVACQLNVKIAKVMAEILVAERENQAMLERAINAVQEEIKGVASGGKAVRAYWGRGAGTAGFGSGGATVIDENL